MATIPTSPAAPPAAAASASTGTAASSTPVSSIPASTPASTPATPATPAGGSAPVQVPAALDSDAAVAQMVAAAEAKGFGSEQKPATEVQKPAAAATEGASVEEKPAEAGAATEEPVKTAPEEESGYSLDEDGFVGAKDLATKIDANEALKAALPQELRDEIMANARLAEVAAAFREVVSSPAEAKILAQTAQEYASFSEAFSMIGNDVSKGTTEMVRKLIEGSAIRDENGALIKRADGTIQTDGTATKFFNELFDRGFIAKVVKKVEALGDENVQAALDLVMESVGMRPSTAVQDPNQDPALAARQADLDRREAELNRQRMEEHQTTVKQYQEALNGDLNTLYTGEQTKLLSLATGLSALERSAVESQLEAAVKEAIKNDPAYNLRKNEIRRKPYSAARRAEEVKLAKDFLSDRLVRIAKPILLKAGVSVTKRAQERQAAQAARAEAARSEVNGGSSVQPIRPASPTDSAAQVRQRVTDTLTKELGHAPTDSEITIRIMMDGLQAKGKTA